MSDNRHSLGPEQEPRPAEPRLAEPHLEDQLPDDLAALAEQLSADAEALAASYPAGSPTKWLGESLGTASRRRFGWWRAAAVALVGAGVSTLYGGWLYWGSINRAEPTGAQAERSPAVQEVVQAPVISADEVPAFEAVPAGVFESLSSPEQEALLDLMESEGVEQSSLSI